MMKEKQERLREHQQTDASQPILQPLMHLVGEPSKHPSEENISNS